MPETRAMLRSQLEALSLQVRECAVVEELPVKEMWVGFRPTSRDDAPILGPTSVEGLVVATGHHRNGVLLAPLTIDAVSAYMLDGSLPDEIERFGIGRFSEETPTAAGIRK